MTAALESQAVLSGPVDELAKRGADAAAAQVRELIAETRRNVTTPTNPTPGRRLLDALSSDPRALLEAT